MHTHGDAGKALYTILLNVWCNDYIFDLCWHTAYVVTVCEEVHRWRQWRRWPHASRDVTYASCLRAQSPLATSPMVIFTDNTLLRASVHVKTMQQQIQICLICFTFFIRLLKMLMPYLEMSLRWRQALNKVNLNAWFEPSYQKATNLSTTLVLSITWMPDQVKELLCLSVCC